MSFLPFVHLSDGRDCWFTDYVGSQDGRSTTLDALFGH